MESKGFFQFEIITNVLVSSFRFFEYICYGSMNIVIISVCVDRLQTSEFDVFRRQILTSKHGPTSESVNFIQ